MTPTPAHKPYWYQDGNAIYHGHVIDVLKALSDESVHCVVTSPPYWQQRDYQVEGQIGLEATIDDYVAIMVKVFKEVRRVLRKDGSLYLNLGDSYVSGKPRDNNTCANGRMRLNNRQSFRRDRQAVGDNSHKSNPGLKQKDLCMIPARVAMALQADGWYLRQDIIWHKPNPMPESVTDRCTKSHEYIFLLSKSPKYFYDNDAIKETAQGWNGSKFDTGKTFIHQGERCQIRTGRKWGNADKQSASRRMAESTKKARLNGGLHDSAFGEKRNKRSVWTVATKPFSRVHFAVFPLALIEPCILAGCPRGGTVLDPFGGAMTTGVVAYKHDRKFIMIELSEPYIRDIGIPRLEREMAQRRLF